MKGTTVKIISTGNITHNVKRFTLEKPAGFIYQPGQAVELSLRKDGADADRRPFTMTGENTAESLEFIIKIYESHHGFTEQLGMLSPGDELEIYEPFGTICYRGPGLFIAAGTGITPFIPILRLLKKSGEASSSFLLFANKTRHDVILQEELTEILAENYVDIFSEEPGSAGVASLDTRFLREFVTGDIRYFYVCGPDGFVAKIIEELKILGISDEQIVFER